MATEVKGHKKNTKSMSKSQLNHQFELDRCTLFVAIPEHWGTDSEFERQTRRFSRTPCHDTRTLCSEAKKKCYAILSFFKSLIKFFALCQLINAHKQKINIKKY